VTGARPEGHSLGPEGPKAEAGVGFLGSMNFHCFVHWKRPLLDNKCQTGSRADFKLASRSREFCTQMQFSWHVCNYSVVDITVDIIAFVSLFIIAASLLSVFRLCLY